MLRGKVTRCFRVNYKSTHFLTAKQQLSVGGHFQNSCESTASLPLKQTIIRCFRGPQCNATRVRKATFADYDSAISLPYYGETFDSLPDRYYALINRKDTYGYLVDVEDSLNAGFQLVHFVDNGSVLVFDNLRVRRGMDSRLVLRAILDHISETMTSENKPQPMLCSSHGDRSRQATPGIDMEDGWLMFTQRAKTTIKTDLTKVLRYLRTSGTSLKSAKRLFSHDVMRIFSSPRQCTNLFKGGRILKSNIPYRPLHSNIPLIMDNRTLIVGTNVMDEGSGLLSVGTYSRTPNGLLCDLNFHGNIGSVVEEHLYVQMMALLNRTNTRIIFDISVDDEQDFDPILKVMQNTISADFQIQSKDIYKWYEKPLLKIH